MSSSQPPSPEGPAAIAQPPLSDEAWLAAGVGDLVAPGLALSEVAVGVGVGVGVSPASAVGDALGAAAVGLAVAAALAVGVSSGSCARTAQKPNGQSPWSTQEKPSKLPPLQSFPVEPQVDPAH